jgi:hypothetical protein
MLIEIGAEVFCLLVAAISKQSGGSIHLPLPQQSLSLMESLQ